MAVAMHLSGSLARNGAAVGTGSQADDLQTYRRASGRPDDESSRAYRRKTELGLPLHLAAGCFIYDIRVDAHRLHRRSGRILRLAQSPMERRRIRQRWPIATYVWH